MKDDVTLHMDKKVLTLTKIEAFELYAEIDERNSEVKGYYKDKNIALIDAKGAGWYNSNGTVEPIELYTDGEFLYHVVLAKGEKFVDANRDYNSIVIDKIKNKLSDAELRFLGLV